MNTRSNGTGASGKEAWVARNRDFTKRYVEMLGAEDSSGRPIAGRGTRHGMRDGGFLAADCAMAWLDFEQTWARAPDRIKAWSDLHLGHAKIIKYCDRPFADADAMDEGLLEAASGCVRDDDWLLFLGDIAMWRDGEAVRAWLARCPGRKAVIIGNHDLRGHGRPRGLEGWREAGFEAVASTGFLPLPNDRSVVMTHYPLRDQLIPPRAVNLHGHAHNRGTGGRRINACVEVNGYAPRPLADLLGVE